MIIIFMQRSYIQEETLMLGVNWSEKYDKVKFGDDEEITEVTANIIAVSMYV